MNIRQITLLKLGEILDLDTTANLLALSLRQDIGHVKLCGVSLLQKLKEQKKPEKDSSKEIASIITNLGIDPANYASGAISGLDLLLSTLLENEEENNK